MYPLECYSVDVNPPIGKHIPPRCKAIKRSRCMHTNTNTMRITHPRTPAPPPSVALDTHVRSAKDADVVAQDAVLGEDLGAPRRARRALELGAPERVEARPLVHDEEARRARAAAVLPPAVLVLAPAGARVEAPPPRAPGARAGGREGSGATMPTMS